MADLNSHHLEMAERRLAEAVNIRLGVSETADALFQRAQVEQQAFENLLKHHWKTLHERLPDLDPRLEPFMNTHLRHFFLVGVVAQQIRGEGG